MEPQITSQANDDADLPDTPSSVILIIVKSIVIATALVGFASLGTRMVLALVPL